MIEHVKKYAFKISRKIKASKNEEIDTGGNGGVVLAISKITFSGTLLTSYFFQI